MNGSPLFHYQTNDHARGNGHVVGMRIGGVGEFSSLLIFFEHRLIYINPMIRRSSWYSCFLILNVNMSMV